MDKIAPSSNPIAFSSFAELRKQLATSSTIYVLGSIGARTLSLLLLPVYWHYLEPSDFGILAVANVVTTLLAAVLGLGLTESVTRFYYEWPQPERNHRLGAIWVIDWASSLILGIPLLFLSPIFNLLFSQVPFDPYLRIAVASSILTSLSFTPLMMLRIQERSYSFVGLTVSSVIVKSIISIVLLVFFNYGVLGLLLGELASNLIFVPVYILIMRKSATPGLNGPTTRECLRYSLPILPAVFIDAIMNVADRFVLEKYITLNSLGLYSIGDTIGGLIRILCANLKTAFIPFQMKMAFQNPEAPRVIGMMTTWVVLVIFGSALFVAVCGPYFIMLVNAPKYLKVSTAIPYFVIPSTAAGLIFLYASGIRIAKKTGYSTVISVSYLISGIGSAIILIPKFGLYGAIVSSFLGHATRLIIAGWLSQRFYPIEYEWGKKILLLVGFLLVFGITRILPEHTPLMGLISNGCLATIWTLFCARWLYNCQRVLAR